MPFKIVRNDITKVKADALVNTANPQPVYASGTDGAIYRAAGARELLAERKKIGVIEPGGAYATSAFALSAKYIIHTVGPSWVDGEHGEFDILSSCYRNSLKAAESLSCKSIAFPLIATGVYGFPKDRALETAVSVISRYLMESEMDVILVVFDSKSFELSGRLFSDIDAFVDENYVAKKRDEEYIPRGTEGTKEEERVRRLEETVLMETHTAIEFTDTDIAASVFFQSKPAESLEDTISHVGETFQQKLLSLIDERGMSDVEVYKRANLDRKLFSKIRCNENYKPKKKTALALAIALELSLDETNDLLNRAELALSPSSKSDLIIEYFIAGKEYDIYEINMALFDHHQPLLGG